MRRTTVVLALILSAPPGAVRAADAPAAVPDIGHRATPHPSYYNIWSANCHTEANFFTAVASARGIAAGILVCQGNPESDAQFHTANWMLDGKGRTCIYNWGTPCCWDASASTPDISFGKGQECARSACDKQYDWGQTRAMPAGKLVESPGPQVCAVSAADGPLTLLPAMAVSALSERVKTRKKTVLVPPYPSLPDGAVLTFTEDRLDRCLECCEARASMWTGIEGASVTPNLAKGREDLFRRQCLSTCRHSFSAAINQ